MAAGGFLAFGTLKRRCCQRLTFTSEPPGAPETGLPHVESQGWKRPLRAMSGRVDEMGPLARLRHADCVERCPLSGLTREDICSD
jgi:hypothetical protein